jgi:tetratricopeptide (TPR) repeat protein
MPIPSATSSRAPPPAGAAACRYTASALLAFLLFMLSAFASTAMALDINALWDYSNPALSEQRFIAALDQASADQKLVLQTQIARTYGLRRNFSKARELLARIEPALQSASAEVQARYFLELGRTYASPVHAKDARTAANLDAARRNFLHAHEIAAGARLDFLAIDALHMMAAVDPEPDRQLEWNNKAVAYMERSDQADAREWEGSLRNNIGYALHLKGEYEAALAQFRLSRAAYERAGRVRDVRIADWMIAWTYRVQKKYAEALAIQLDLERAWDADGESDPYVFEELEQLYRALGDEKRAGRYGSKLRKAAK